MLPSVSGLLSAFQYHSSIVVKSFIDYFVFSFRSIQVSVNTQFFEVWISVARIYGSIPRLGPFASAPKAPV